MKSYTQTAGAYNLQLGVLVAHRTNVIGSTDLFVQSGLPTTTGWHRAAPTSPWIVEHGVDAVWHRIEQVCDVAAITRTEAPVNRVFASVRVRRTASSPRYGAVVELQLDTTTPPTWKVVSLASAPGLSNAALYDEDGEFFSDECMPIDVTTGYGDQSAQRLVVADPSGDAIMMYDVNNLRAGAIATVHAPSSTLAPVDIAILGDRENGRDYVFITALWRGSGTPQLRHYNGNLGGLISAPHLTETMAADVRFIQGPLQGVLATPPIFRADLYTLGNQGLRRSYEYRE
jgi:hypothetical protein